MAKAQATAPAPAEEKDALAEMNRLCLRLPSRSLAESQGISIDEAVALRGGKIH